VERFAEIPRFAEQLVSARVLIIDDNRFLREFMRLALERAGFSVDQAGDGADGVERCRTEHPDLVITDLDMPAGAGLEVVRVLRHELPEVRVIACSAEAGDERLDRALEAGARGALHMPFQVPELVDLVDTVTLSS
jgi:two-component system chemotaxis response regulator CheY